MFCFLLLFFFAEVKLNASVCLGVSSALIRASNQEAADEVNKYCRGTLRGAAGGVESPLSASRTATSPGHSA